MNFTGIDYAIVAVYKAEMRLKRIPSEWDITIEMWKMNPQMFGMRGYEKNYPNHKDASKRLSYLLKKGWIIRPKPNYYMVNELGEIHAKELSDSLKKVSPIDTVSKKNFKLHNELYKLSKHPLARNPKMHNWGTISSFLRFQGIQNPTHVRNRLSFVKGIIIESEKWFSKKDALLPGPKNSGKIITKSDLKRVKIAFQIVETHYQLQIGGLLT